MVLAYARTIPGMPASPGITPDMRYLSPAYLPMLVIGVYALKHAGLDGDGVQEALKTLFWLAAIDLPLIFIVLQVIAGNNLAGQVTFVTTLTYLFLAGAGSRVRILLYFSTKRDASLYLYKYSQIRSLSRPFDLRTRCWNFAVNLLQCCKGRERHLGAGRGPGRISPR